MNTSSSRNDRPGDHAADEGAGAQRSRAAAGFALPLDDLYREVILDHFRNPRGRRQLAHASLALEGFNPSCGDQVKLALEITDGRIEQAQVLSQGCSISIASGSIMADMIGGRPLEEVQKLIAEVKGMMQGQDPAPDQDFGDLEALEGVRKFPVRVKCALLPWTTLEEALSTSRSSEEG